MESQAVRDLSRRHVLRATALGAVALPVLAACGGGGDSSPKTAQTPTSTGATTPAGGEVLAKVSDVEVGGAVFIEDPSVVVTQPAAGEFHAFDRTCTHRQCPVTDILDGKIHCHCHDSLYDMSTGDNVGGPAPSPLTKIEVTVKGGNIVRG